MNSLALSAACKIFLKKDRFLSLLLNNRRKTNCLARETLTIIDRSSQTKIKILNRHAQYAHFKSTGLASSKSIPKHLSQIAIISWFGLIWGKSKHLYKKKSNLEKVNQLWDHEQCNVKTESKAEKLLFSNIVKRHAATEAVKDKRTMEDKKTANDG